MRPRGEKGIAPIFLDYAAAAAEAEAAAAEAAVAGQGEGKAAAAAATANGEQALQAARSEMREGKKARRPEGHDWFMYYSASDARMCIGACKAPVEPRSRSCPFN